MKQKLTALLVLIATMVGSALFPLTAYAAGASISVVANKATVADGGSLVVAVYMNGGGTPVNAVEADLGFPSSKLQYIGVSYSGSAFGVQAPPTPGDGSVAINVGSTSPVSGSGLVATVTFKGISGSGSATISVLGSSHLVNANDNSDVPHANGATTVNFGSVAASSSGGSSAAAPVAEAPKDTTPPTISETKYKDLQPNGGTITWKTNEPSDSVVEYGLDTSYGLSASVASPTTNHEVVLSSSFLTPKTVFHYRVKSTDGAGNVQTGADQTLPIPGIPVTIIVRSADGQPQAGAMVTLDNTTGITDEHGSVTIPSGAGNKKIITSFNGATLQKSITVDKSAKKLPSYQLALSRAPENRWMYSSAALALVVIVLIGLDAVIFGSRFFAKAFRIKMHLPALPQPHHSHAEPLLAAEPVEEEKPIALTERSAPRYTTIRPRDLEGDLDIKAAADMPLYQLVNNIPRVGSEPAVTQIAIKHFNEPDTSEAELPLSVDEKPAAPKKVTRRVKKPAVKAAKGKAVLKKA
ncbi:MAG: fibronectin type protein [Candidatus Saccharibacteria bacterium]|nr:fibronectin type protein [Candidatus Saccharibacteria bacterium]